MCSEILFFFRFFSTIITLWAVWNGQIWPAAHSLPNPDVDSWKINIAAVTKTATGAQSSGKGSAGERRQDLGVSCYSKQILEPAASARQPHPRPTEYKFAEK